MCIFNMTFSKPVILFTKSRLFFKVISLNKVIIYLSIKLLGSPFRGSIIGNDFDNFFYYIPDLD